MMSSPTIFIVDDDDAVRDSLQVLLASAGFKKVRAYASGRRFLDEALPQPGDCLLADIRMPDMDGLELQAELNRRASEVAVIIMTGHGDVPLAVRAMKAGALDFIEKPFPDDQLIASLRHALAVAEEAGHKSKTTKDALHHFESLTQREREVLEGMIAGRPNKVIAHDLGISPRTVEIHRARVMDKMQARSLSALVRMAFAAGIGSKPE